MCSYKKKKVYTGERGSYGGKSAQIPQSVPTILAIIVAQGLILKVPYFLTSFDHIVLLKDPY